MATKLDGKTRSLPKTLGACADELGGVEDRVAELNKQLEDAKAYRGRLEAHLIEELPASDADGICGKVKRATVVKKRVPTLKDWKKFTAHLKKTGDFDLVQHRLSSEAVKSRWDEGRQVPGVQGITVKKISLTKK
jgi:hypothetical protein